MALLKDVQVMIPSADAVVGRVVAFHNGKHVDLGEYVGEGVVSLSPAGTAALAALTQASEQVAKPAPAARRKNLPGLSPASNSDLGS